MIPSWLGIEPGPRYRNCPVDEAGNEWQVPGCLQCQGKGKKGLYAPTESCIAIFMGGTTGGKSSGPYGRKERFLSTCCVSHFRFPCTCLQ